MFSFAVAPTDAAVDRIKKAVNDTEPKIREMAVIAVAKSRFPASDKVQVFENALLDEMFRFGQQQLRPHGRQSLPASEFAQRIADKLPTASDEAALTLIKALGAIGPELAQCCMFCCSRLSARSSTSSRLLGRLRSWSIQCSGFACCH